MRIKLKNIRPNPFRIFRLDPIEADRVEILVHSIKETSFWGGLMVREKKDEPGIYELPAGHTRLAAAIESGETEADLTVAEISDERMIWIYGMENCSQRGNSASAILGLVASAVWFLAYAILKGEGGFVQIWTKGEDLKKLQGNITSGRGIGRETIEQVLKGLPGIHKSVIVEQIKNLKVSGDYAKIIEEVSQKIAEEQKEERAELERREEAAAKAEEEAEKAKEKAAKEKSESAKREANTAKKKEEESKAKVKELTLVKDTRDNSEKAVKASNGQKPLFDLEGVLKYLKNEHVVRVFRDIVTEGAALKYLPTEAQAPLAKHLAEEARKQDVDLSGTFIFAHIQKWIFEVINEYRRKTRQLPLTKAEQMELASERAEKEWIEARHNCARHIVRAIKYGNTLIELKKKHPKTRFEISEELTQALAETPKFEQIKQQLNL